MVELPELIVEDEYPLSPVQQGYLSHRLLRSERGGDLWQVVCTLNEPVDTAKLLSAWESVVARHAVLRTSIEWEGRPEPVQKVHRSVRLPAAVLDWRHLDSAQQRDRLASLMAEERSAGFHLNQAPLMRLAVMDCGSGQHELLCTFHCAVLDSRSVSILIREVFGLYDASRGGPPCRLPAPRPYRAYIDWLGSQKPDASHAFWRRHLAGLSAPTPFLQSVRSGGEEGVGSVEVTLTPDETRRLHAFAREANCTVRTLVAGAWALLLSRHTGEDDVLFGVTRACRRSTFDGADDVVGAYVHTLPFRVAVVPGQSVVSWLADLRAEQLACGTHEHTSLARIHSWSDIPSGAELFETLVVFEGHRLDSTLRRHGGPWLNRRFACEGHTGYPVTLVCRSEAELALRLEHTRRALDDSTAARMLTHVRRLLEGLVRQPDRPIADIPMLGDEERTQLLPVPRPSGIQTFCLHERFERRVAEAPNSPAVTFLGATESYEALNRRANQLAHRLRSMGVGPDILVGLHLERSIELITAMLGILKAGGAYVPLDPASLPESLRFIVDDARLSIIVTSRSLSARLPTSGIEFAYVDEVDEESVDNPPPVAEPDNLAYAVYGSESAARPPGVLITHANVSRLFDASEIWFRFGRDDVWALSHSFASDFAAWETWGALLYGGRLVVVPYWVGCDPDAFIDLLARERVTVLHQAPAAFQRLSDAEGERSRPAALVLRSIVLGGEAVDAPSLGPWFERHGDERPQVASMFGIAETTIHAAYRRLVKADIQAGAGKVIGVPIADLDVYVLDRLQRLVPIGVTGEIYVGGPGVGRGYLDRPKLTHAHFVMDPVGGTGTRLFRTGELGRWLPSGELESRGRIDGQAVRHLRIAPGKLDAASELATDLTGSGSAAVIVSSDASSITRRATSDVPLTPVSRWFFDRSVANPNHWNHSILVEVPGHFDVSALDAALAAVVAHHDAFRLRFKEGDRGWQCGYALAGSRVAVERVDLREYPPEMVSGAIESAAAAAQVGLHITDGPILRVLYFGCGSELPGRLLVTIHRLVADARSIRVFLEDLETAYVATRAGREPWLPNRTTSFRFWAERLVDYASTRAHDGLSSWTRLADSLAAVLPRDHAAGRELNTEASARTVTVCLTVPETDALLRRTDCGHGAGVDGLLLAALAKTLLPWMGRDDVVVDVERSCREDVPGDVNLSRTIGAFTTTFPCRLETGDGSTASLLSRIQHSLRVHDGGLSFGVLRYLSPDADVREALDRVPKPQLRFHYEGDVEASIAGSSLFTSAAEPIGPWRADENERPHLIEVVALVAAGRFKVQWRYSSAFHDTSTISALASRYLEALRDVGAHGEAQSTFTSIPSPFELADLDQAATEQLSRRYPTLTDVYPLTPLQQISFSMDGIEGAPAFEQWEVQLEGPLDGPRLRDAWEHVVGRHPVLRSAFVHVGAMRTRQVVLERVDVPWRTEDWRGCTREEIDGLLREFLAVDRTRSFDLSAPPLVRASLLRTGETTHRLILTVHHVIADGSSRARILSELAALYSSGLTALRAPACAYREYVGWLQSRSEVHSEQFWRVLLSGVVNPTPIPAPATRAHHREPPGEAVRALTAVATTALARFARSYEISLDVIVGAAWSVVLAHHSGQSDVVYGAPFAGRPDEIDNVETMVGPCVNNLPVRVHVDTGAGVIGWLRQLQGLLVELALHQTTPSRSIQMFSGIRAWRRVFDSLVVVQDGSADGTASSFGGVEMLPLPGSQSTVHPATMNVRVGAHLTVEAVGAGGRFGGKSAAVAADDLVRVLTRLVSLDEGGTVADLMAALPIETRGGAGRVAAEGRRRRRPRLAPRTELERALVEIWRELFDGDIGTDENYFDLGAHSLMLLRALERIRSTVKRDLPMAALFQHPTVRDFAAYLTSGGSSHHRRVDIRSRSPHPSHRPDRRPAPVELDRRS